MNCFFFQEDNFHSVCFRTYRLIWNRDNATKWLLWTKVLVSNDTHVIPIEPSNLYEMFKTTISIANCQSHFYSTTQKSRKMYKEYIFTSKSQHCFNKWFDPDSCQAIYWTKADLHMMYLNAGYTFRRNRWGGVMFF